jgi:hypothetical protein
MLMFHSIVSHLIAPRQVLHLLSTPLRRRITVRPTSLEDVMPSSGLPTSERTLTFLWWNQTEYSVNYVRNGFNYVKTVHIVPIHGCSIDKNARPDSKCCLISVYLIEADFKPTSKLPPHPESRRDCGDEREEANPSVSHCPRG